MKSGTFTNNTSFTASAASVVVPSGSTIITVRGYSSASFTVPNRVRVVSVDGMYVGVTPNKTYSLGGWTPFEQHSGEEGRPFLQSSSGVYWYGDPPEDYPDQDSASFTIRWSADINAHTPNVTDY
jgi:hypothetical protein